MKTKKPDKIVIFGAGKIGRSFIGQLFSMGGYEVVFIDVYQPVTDELNRRRNYNVVIKGDVESVISVQNVRGVFAGEVEKVTQELVTARIVAISVGLSGLKSIMPLIVNGLIKRFETTGALPLDIIIAENLRNAAGFMHQGLKVLLPDGYPLEERVGLIETSIGKMVPIMLKNDMEADILQVFAEPYNTLILDKLAFKNPIPAIKGLAPKENIKAWVDRKLFIHNLGHATAAYWGYLYNPGFQYIWQALEVPSIHKTVKKTMLQAADLLQKKYPGEFTMTGLTQHVEDLLMRFQNRALGDTIYRVGCDLPRKLGPDDRLAGAIRLAVSLGLPYDNILETLVAGCRFRAKDEKGQMHPSDIKFLEICNKGITEVLKTVCGFDESDHTEIFREGEIINRRHLSNVGANLK